MLRPAGFEHINSEAGLSLFALAVKKDHRIET
jgi:hypothetical protein